MSTNEREDLEGMLDRLERSSEADEPAWAEAALLYESPTLVTIDSKRRPAPKPVCESCPHSMWFASETELKCYCRLMHAVTWTSDQPVAILSCDGIVLSTE
jgi:hypothetical protein